MKTLIAVLAFALTPAAAFAQCSHNTTMSCEAGTTWDAETRTCVATTS
ncbi:carbohydrate-binding module family 14 protein [Roseobacter sp. HKCCA0434]|nr:carbohydrate-binding module family 14 protein [Roseobacter sp. HKCCA0434]